MPELPEAERGRRLADKALVNRTIVRVWAKEDRIVFSGVSPRAFVRRLTGRSVQATQRHGKHIWLTMDRPPHPIFHFGMSGFFRHYAKPADRPKYSKVDLFLNDGTIFSMSNARRLGRIRLLVDPANEEPISKLGFDPLHAIPSTADLYETLKKRRTRIKALLLDQSFSAGVGNWIADEVLYHARISPLRYCNSLTTDEVKQLRAKLKGVIYRAVAVNADSKKFPRTWLFHRRWRDGMRKKKTRNVGALPLRYDVVGGRTTAWVPGVQR